MFWHDRPDDEDAIFLVDECRRYSYGDVFRLGDALFEGSPPSVAVLLCDRSIATVAAYFGALRCGVVPLLLDGRVKEPALARTIDAYAPRYILADPSMTLPGYTQRRRLETKALFERDNPSEPSLHKSLALLIPTSGSTGDPKCVRITAANIEACTRAVVAYLDMTPDRITVSLLPFHYAYGLSVLHNTAFVRGKMLLTGQSILERSLWQRIEDAGVTDLAGVPFTFQTLRRICLSQTTLTNLVCVTQAGGPLPAHLTKYFWQYFTANGVRYFTMYGQTEAAPRISFMPPDRAMEKLGSVGIPIHGGTVSIVGGAPGSGEGELVYEGANVSMGYAETAVDLAQGDVFGGRLHTGDQARIDPDGYITILGRKKRSIKLHGVSVNLDHAESVLRNAGLDCMLVGKENCLVVCTTGIDPAPVHAALDLNFDFHPSAIRIEHCETLPLTASDKPNYADLSRRFVEAQKP